MEYQQFDISALLPALSEHALSTNEFIRVKGKQSADEWVGKRKTTLSCHTLQLPVPYIKAVVNTYGSGEISRGKAAEMLMIDTDEFDKRFGRDQEPPEELSDGADRNLAFSY
jgi:hypothetical protein